MRYPKASAIYSLCIGVLMAGMWTVFLAAGQVPEFCSRPAEIFLHLVVEFLTAVLLILVGISSIRRLKWGAVLLPFSFGMLTYSLILSPGYYLQRGETPFVLMFAVLLVLTIVFTVITVATILVSDDKEG